MNLISSQNPQKFADVILSQDMQNIYKSMKKQSTLGDYDGHRNEIEDSFKKSSGES